MANPEHLKIVKQGGVKWNEWRIGRGVIIADLSSADLGCTDLGGVDLRNADLRNANLSLTLLNVASLDGANLRGADLGGADLHGADLRGADLSNAILHYTILNNVDLAGASFVNAVLSYTMLTDCDLSQVKGLETVTHNAPSSVGIDSIYKSHGKIPEVFLRGCGVPDDFITYMRSLTVQPIQFYSCFISYSSKDQDFAERLHADLQSKGVRCWFAPEDLKIGDRFRDRIDESIRLHDRLLLILSENSVSSPWVSDEVEAAIEREHREGRTVLFPIKIDDAVMESEQAWAAAIRRTRHIGDFTRLKDHDSYRKAFERLLRDLKAGEKKQ